MADHTEEQLKEAEKKIREKYLKEFAFFLTASANPQVRKHIDFLWDSWKSTQAALTEAEKEIARLKERVETLEAANAILKSINDELRSTHDHQE